MNIADRSQTPLNHRLARNFALVIFVALPLVIATATAVLWIHPPGDMPRPTALSFEGVFGGAAFWFLMLILPTVFVGAIHQVVLAALPGDWSARRTRLAIVGTAVTEGFLIGFFVGRDGGADTVLILAVALLPASVVYGLFAAPLRGTPRRDGLAPEYHAVKRQARPSNDSRS